jgi:AmiR/NasT family two-component response regulator
MSEPGTDYSGLDIVVATSRDENGEVLFRELQRTRARVRHVWPAPCRLPDDTDVIFCDATKNFTQAIPWLPGEPGAALVAIVDATTDLDTIRTAAPDAVLHRPFTRQSVLMSLMLARAHFTYAGRLLQRIHKLDETSRMIRSVERAKTMLMATRKMREEEAYKFIRTQAMTRRISIGALATAIVDSGDLLG